MKNGQNAEASLGILDSQSVRWGNNQELNSYDGNKKVKGVKRHVVVDKNGFLVAVMVTVAHIHDSKAVMMMMRVLKEMLCSIKVIVADGGYRGDIIEQVKKLLATLYKWSCGPTTRKAGLSLSIKDGCSKGRFHGSTMIEGYAGTMNYCLNPLNTWSSLPL